MTPLPHSTLPLPTTTHENRAPREGAEPQDTGVRPVCGRPAGIYLHIPFCAALCPYCDFAVYVRKEIPHEAYTDAVLLELETRIQEGELKGRRVSSVYFGGGTPSILRHDCLERLVSRLKEIAPDAVEWSIEANPVDIDQETITLWENLGFTRTSLGVQSFDDTYLQRLGRAHTGRQALEGVTALLESRLQLSIDLIFAGPNHTLERWERDLQVVRSLDTLDHLSAYHLTVEPNTRFANLARKNRLYLPEDDVATSMLQNLRDACETIGLTQYEVSSYAKEGGRSRHNTHYWTGAEYLGIGVGAHGLRVDGEVVRSANTRKLRPYLQNPTQQRTLDYLDPVTYLAERLFTGLRTDAGINFEGLEEQFRGVISAKMLQETQKLLEVFVERGFQAKKMRTDAVVYVPTTKGYLFADHLAEEVFELLL